MRSGATRSVLAFGAVRLGDCSFETVQGNIAKKFIATY